MGRDDFMYLKKKKKKKYIFF